MELVRAGWAPYFVKYGRSVRFDARFVAALAFAAVVLVYVVLDRTPDWGLLGFAGPWYFN